MLPDVPSHPVPSVKLFYCLLLKAEWRIRAWESNRFGGASTSYKQGGSVNFYESISSYCFQTSVKFEMTYVKYLAFNMFLISAFYMLTVTQPSDLIFEILLVLEHLK